MRSKRTINVISCHAEGEVGDVIIGGVAPPPGDTLWAQSRWLAQDGALRGLMLHEPRGGVHKHVNLLVPPKDPRAAMGFIIMEPTYNPPMSGSNSICVSTVLLECGLVEMTEPLTRFTLEAPGGLVEIEAECADGAAKRIRVRNVASFAAGLDQPLEVTGESTLTVDTAYGGDSFVIVDADALGLTLSADAAKDLVTFGRHITAAANEQIGFTHPERHDWQHISFCLFATRAREVNGTLQTRHACVIDPGKIDRSPTGTAVSARMACLHARGQMHVGDTLQAQSIIDSVFEGRIHSETTCGTRNAIHPEIAGRAWLTGSHQFWLDSTDPYPRGYRISDTWPTPSSEDSA